MWGRLNPFANLVCVLPGELLIMQYQTRDLMRKSFLCILAIFLAAFPSFAQTNALSVFEGAIDQINCETIRFIHREANRPDVANNMECLSFESILKSIPEDESNTTGKLARDINTIKSRYKADKDIGPQLDAAISVAVRKIESRPRKQNIPDFKKKLEDIKAETVKNAQALTENTPSETAPPVEDNEAVTEEEAVTDDGNINLLPDEENGTTPSEGGSNWLGWLSLIISLLALVLAGYALLKKGQKSSPRNAYAPMANTEMMEANRQRDDADIKDLETKMYRELKRMQDEFDEKISAITASTGYTEPESIPEPVPEPQPAMDEETGVPSLSDAMVETMDIPVDRSGQEEIESHASDKHASDREETVKEEPVDLDSEYVEAPLFSVEEKGMEPMEAAADEDVDEEEIQEEANQQGGVEEEPVPASEHSGPPLFGTSPSQPAEPPLAFEEEEEEGLPFYRYTGTPDADGSFPDEKLSETAGPDAVFEVEMYEDVPNKAFFSPLPYPEIVARVLADPARYLEPCCSYSDDPAGKQHIIVVEEGTLRKQGDRWIVHDKAKLRFA